MTTVEPDRWIRAVGSDIAAGETVLHEGTVLGAAEIGLLATVGVTNVAVYGSPSVGVMSTGNELVKPSTATTGSQIHDSNRSMLLAAVTESGGDAVDLGIVPDDVGAFEARLREAWANRVDIVVTSGGVSMGSLDLVKPTLERIGTVHFGRLNMKPGKPTTYATIEIDGVKKHIFALPGNPVSSLVTFKLLVDPCIKRFAGARPEECHHRRVTARLAQPLTLDPARPEYVSCAPRLLPRTPWLS
jgi:gephyrin